MSARVQLLSGISAGAEFWIDRPVMRIGSNPGFEICILSADLASHALTLEYSKGRYKVHLRSDDQVCVDGNWVDAGKAAEWLPQQVLEINGEHRLLLEIDGDAAPSPKPDESKFAAHDTEDETATGGTRSAPTAELPREAGAKKSRATQLVVTLLSVALLAALLWMDGPSSATPRVAPSFSSVVEMALKSEKTPQVLVHRLQFAQAALVRGDRNVARENFSALRDDLLQQIESFRAAHREAELAILAFVEFQLGNIR